MLDLAAFENLTLNDAESARVRLSFAKASPSDIDRKDQLSEAQT